MLNLKGLKKIRFWMTFGDEYLTHLRVLANVGMMRIDPVDYKGTKVIPMEFLKRLLPDPASLAENYTGKTCIGCIIEGIKDGKPRKKCSSTTSATTPRPTRKCARRPSATRPACPPWWAPP